MFTEYQAQYFAHALTLKGSGGDIDTLTRSISNARVDLNPHQIDAALFALRSPLSKGVILADEVGLGKTIEAGIVIAQRWAERRRRILLIVPASIRKQWAQELIEKFFLPVSVLDTQTFNQLRKTGVSNPFDRQDQLVICSYNFAAAKSQEIQAVPWHLVVIDEAHRLRNVFKPSVKMTRRVAETVRNTPKLLLTATPLQNSLMELFGLVSVIDPHVFGDQESFREQFIRAPSESKRNAALRSRLRPVCTRTLRQQVVEYIPFTRRIPITQAFLPGDDEHRLYELVSEYLQKEVLIALPKGQRTLLTLVLRKLLASSSFAIASTLRRLVARLEHIEAEQALLDQEDLEAVDELEEEWREEEEPPTQSEPANTPEIDPALLKAELADLRRFAEMAEGIRTNAKGSALLQALRVAFDRAAELGAQRKAVVFTESRRTQQYLFEILSANGYDGQLVLINGSNADPESKRIYEAWFERHKGQATISGSRLIDMKAAIMEHFRDSATILLATEAAAEGVNLQFCSLVVNYDLPWNPQRVEQRIGRCHRYGQKHDVVVVNFLNRRNEADQRVFQLLSEKFRLFDGVFGASDEVLGAIESGVDIERRIAAVYRDCRTTEEITAAFDALQRELDEQIQNRLSETRRAVLEHFDEDVNARLHVHQDRTIESLSQRERWLLALTRAGLDGQAQFDPAKPRFRYSGSHAPSGFYNFNWREAEQKGDIFYRQDHPLAVLLIEEAIARKLPMATLTLDYTGYGSVVSVLQPLLGCSGWLKLSKLTVEALGTDEYLIFAATTDQGTALDEEQARKIMLLPAQAVPARGSGSAPDLGSIRRSEIERFIKRVDERNGRFFDEEVLKLDAWSDDLKQGLEREIKAIDAEIRELRKKSSAAISLQEKLEIQKNMRTLEGHRNRQRRELFQAQDAIDVKRDELIKGIESQLKQSHSVAPVFLIRWHLK